MTKAEQVAELRKLGVDVDGSDYTQVELQALIETEHARALAVLPGDAVTYTFTAEHAAALSYREAKFARFVKGVAPFEPRTYSEGDVVRGRVVSSYDDGTATVDVLGAVPRFTLDRVEQGDGVGQFRVKE